jgi:hypothetical protein
MRTYGTTAPNVWVEVSTDANGENGYVYLTTLIQALLLNTNENPLYANYGLPAVQSVQSQTAPDSAIARTQAQFSQYFQNLVVSRFANTQNPTYDINAIFLSGTIYQGTVAT